MHAAQALTGLSMLFQKSHEPLFQVLIEWLRYQILLPRELIATDISRICLKQAELHGYVVHLVLTIALEVKQGRMAQEQDVTSARVMALSTWWNAITLSRYDSCVLVWLNV